MDSRVERVVFETGRHRIVGDLVLPREGYRSRLSEYLNRGDIEFVPLVNVELTHLEGQERDVEKRAFVAIARGHIQLAHPLDADEMPRGEMELSDEGRD